MPSSVKRVPRGVLFGLGALALAAVVVVVVLLAGGSSGDDEPERAAVTTPAPAATDAEPAAPPAAAEDHPKVPAPRGNAYPNGDTSNTRRYAGTITAANVSELKEAWSYPLTARSTYGAFASSPVVRQGVVYIQDLMSNVAALDLETGKVLWEQRYEDATQGPNGVVVADGKVFGATSSAAFALDQRSGKELWSKNLIRSSQEGIDMAPGYHDGMVYVSTVPGNAQKFYNAGGIGILWALDADTGKKRWRFKTIPSHLWGNKNINNGGGLWYTPAFDDEGDMYFGVGNAGPFPGTEDKPWGSSRRGRNLYTNSLVKMDAKTGKLKWYYQETPHDIYDWDLQDPPILTRVQGRAAVVTASKAGFVTALDRRTGKRLWKRAVGVHNGHDKDNLYAMRGQYGKLKTPMEVYPGLLGGVIAPIATDGQSVFAPVINNSVVIQSQEQTGSGQTMTGEVVAVDIDSGRVRWKKDLPTGAFGATSVMNDLVFATTFDGKVYAFNTKSGKEEWQTQLPAQTNAGVMVTGDTVLAPAGMGNGAALVAYRLP